MKNINIILMFLISLGVNAQIDKVNEKELKKADEKFENFAYLDARQIYLDIAKSGYKSESLYKKLGDSYYFNNLLSESLQWYEELYNFQKTIEPTYLFRYAMALKSVQKYKEADQVMEKYYETIGQNIEVKTKKQTVDELQKINVDKYIVEKANINSDLSDFAPSYYLSQLVFASNRKNKTKTNQKNTDWNKLPFSDLYFVNIRKNNSLADEIEPFTEEINSLFHESSTCFTKDGNTMYFSRNNTNNNKVKTNANGIALIKIFRSKKGVDGKWQKPEALSFNSDDYSTAHPALSTDEKKLYFSSDMPGTFGLSDIFVVDIYQDGTFGKPINLGNKINTPLRESYPFLTKKNKLFFSSDGHEGLGGFDNFETTISENNEIGEIYNLGAPINSPTDDFSLIFDPSDNSGFFASNRTDGSGADDIYSFKLEVKEKPCKKEINGYVKNETEEFLQNINVDLLDENLKKIATTETNSQGFYKFELECNKRYIVRIAEKNYIPSEKIVENVSGDAKIRDFNFDLKKGGNLTTNIAPQKALNIGDDLAKILQLEPIYFDSDKSYIRPDAEIELQKIIGYLKKNPSVSIDVRSHTDSNGNKEYNQKLSQRRANSTVDYIVKNGIAKSRLTGHGFGDVKLVNKCKQGVKCSEAQHQLNRRSEFIITKKGNDLGTAPTPLKNSKSTSINPGNLTGQYDFDSNKKVYTVQLSALKDLTNIPFTLNETMFSHKYSDGLVRIYSGVFYNRAEAIAYKQILLDKGFADVFVIILQGEERFAN